MDTLPVTVGKTFDTIEEVEETLKLLERDYYHPLRRFNSQTVSEYNRRREKAGSELRIAEQLKFVFILYRCVHYGEPRKRGKGIRPTQHHFALQCPAELYISYDHNVKKFIVKKCNLNHCHPVGREILPHYPFKRRLDSDQMKEVQSIVALGPKLKLVRQYILKQFGKKVILKDLQNVRSKAKLQAKGSCNEAQITINRLEEEMQKDRGSKGGVIANEANELTILYYASSHLVCLYEKFPEVVMIDGTYNVNISHMPLYSFMIEDGNGHGRTIFYAATTDESTQHLVAIIQAFKQCHPSHLNTKVFIIDKDFTEMAVLKEEFPSATILFCQFHVIKCFYKAVSDHEVPKERRNALRNVLHDIVYSEHMDDYVDYLSEIVRLGNPSFEKYFFDNWNSCTHMWVSFKRDSSIHFGNTTNNRLECSHSKLKELINRTSSLSEMFEGVLTFMKFVDQESSHHAFVEQFTSVCTKLDHIPGMKDVTTVCTEYASRLLQHQVEVAQKIEYEFSDGDGPIVTVTYKDHTHNVNTESSTCTCSFWSTMLLPCRHIISVRLHKGLTIVDHSILHQRWLKSYQIDFIVENSNPDDNADTSHQVEYDLLPEPPMQSTLSQAQKYKKMLSLCQKFAVEASMVGMSQFQEMYDTAEILLHNWEAGLKCVVVTCSDECEEVTSSKEVAITVPLVQQEGIAQYEDGTQYKDGTQREDDTQHDDGMQYEDGTQYKDGTQREDDTQHEDGTQYKSTPQYEDISLEDIESDKEVSKQKESQRTNDSQKSNVSSQPNQLKQLATITCFTKDSIHLKPCVKVRGRPKYSSKFWPSKSKKKSNTGKENVEPNAQSYDTTNATQRKRSQRCGECIPCKSKDCQKCSACQDMVKYGGPGKKKQCCINRRCVEIKSPPPTNSCTDCKYIWVDLSKSSWWTLKPEIREVVYDIWKEAEQNIFGKMGSSDMMDADVFALFPGNWLTDKGITTFLKVAAKNLNQTETFVASTFLYNSMCRDMNLAKRWYRDVNICDYKLWVIPVNISQLHWIVVMLYTKTKEMWLFDSIASTYPHCEILFQDWLTAKTRVIWKVVYASLKISNIPMQSNSNDCGIFVCMYALHEMLQQRSYHFSLGNTDEIREWVTWKIAETCLPEAYT